MLLGKKEFLVQHQPNNDHNVSPNGQINSSGEIKIIQSVNAAGWAVNGAHSHGKWDNLNPRGVNSVLSRSQQHQHGEGAPVPVWGAGAIPSQLLFPEEAAAAYPFSQSQFLPMAALRPSPVTAEEMEHTWGGSALLYRASAGGFLLTALSVLLCVNPTLSPLGTSDPNSNAD